MFFVCQNLNLTIKKIIGIPINTQPWSRGAHSLLAFGMISLICRIMIRIVRNYFQALVYNKGIIIHSCYYKKMLLLCWFEHFLDSRAEICQIFRCFFGKFKISIWHSEINWPFPKSCFTIFGFDTSAVHTKKNTCTPTYVKLRDFENN